jgi:hypothetical protein
MGIHYFLFGERAVGTYFTMHDGIGENPSHQEVAEAIKRDSYDVMEFEEGRVHPFLLLEAYDGWQGYTTIPEELYNLLKKA